MPRRILLLMVALGLVLGRLAFADEPAAPVPPPPFKVDTEEPHRFKATTLGIVGGSALVTALAGGAMILYSHTAYDTYASGSMGTSCRPCSTKGIAGLRAEEYGGYTLLGIGGALLVTEAVMLVLDARHRERHLHGLALTERYAAGWRF